MSHQTGIRANEALKKFFSQCKDGKIRAFKISIVDEQLVLSDKKKINKTWNADFEDVIKSFIEENQPCYMFFRLDVKNVSGFEWLFISWIPETAPIRQKMLYASTKATLKQEFGTSDIKDELQGTNLGEISLKSYLKHKEDQEKPGPLTNREEEIVELLKHERASASEISIDLKQKTLSGITFPMTENAQKAIVDFGQKLVDYVQLKIDIQEEKIYLEEACKLKCGELPKKIPSNSACYHLFLFKHTYEECHVDSMIFIYSMPGYVCSIKERMLYSSCKGSLLESIDVLGVKVDKKIEIDSGDDLTYDFLMNEVHPKTCSVRASFDKPKGPPNRGAKRITKLQK